MAPSNRGTGKPPRDSRPDLVSAQLRDAARDFVAVAFAECGLTDKHGWLTAFDELSEYLGRL